MTDLDTLLTQALALVSVDQRGELADLIEAIVTAARQSARRQALEEAAQLVCLGCLAGEPRKDDAVLGLIHQRSDERPTQCTAGPIHWLFRRGEAAPHAPRV